LSGSALIAGAAVLAGVVFVSAELLCYAVVRIVPRNTVQIMLLHVTIFVQTKLNLVMLPWLG
jgi:hypothetical protein